MKNDAQVPKREFDGKVVVLVIWLSDKRFWFGEGLEGFVFFCGLWVT